MIVLLEMPQPFDHETFGPLTLTHRNLSFQIGGGGPNSATVQGVLGFYLSDAFGPRAPAVFVECHDTRDQVRFSAEEYASLIASEGRAPVGDVSIGDLATAAAARFDAQWIVKQQRAAQEEERRRG